MFSYICVSTETKVYVCMCVCVRVRVRECMHVYVYIFIRTLRTVIDTTTSQQAGRQQAGLAVGTAIATGTVNGELMNG